MDQIKANQLTESINVVINKTAISLNDLNTSKKVFNLFPIRRKGTRKIKDHIIRCMSISKAGTEASALNNIGLKPHTEQAGTAHEKPIIVSFDIFFSIKGFTQSILLKTLLVSG